MTLNARHPLSRPSRRHRGARQQRGVTLLELLIGVGVIIVVMVIVLMGMRSLNAQMDRTALLRQAPQIHAALAGYGSTGGMNFRTMDTAGAYALGAFRSENVVKGTDGRVESVHHEFGGKLFVKGFDQAFGSTKPGKGYTLSYTEIPQAQCAGIARGLALLAEGVWVDQETTEKSHAAPTANVIKTPGDTSPIDAGKLAQACTPQGGPGTVSVHALMSN